MAFRIRNSSAVPCPRPILKVSGNVIGYKCTAVINSDGSLRIADMICANGVSRGRH